MKRLCQSATIVEYRQLVGNILWVIRWRIGAVSLTASVQTRQYYRDVESLHSFTCMAKHLIVKIIQLVPPCV